MWDAIGVLGEQEITLDEREILIKSYNFMCCIYICLIL